VESHSNYAWSSGGPDRAPVSRREFLRGLGLAAAAASGAAALSGLSGSLLRPMTAGAAVRTYRLTADLGVPGDGVTEASALIATALARVPAGSAVVCDASRYLINGTVLLQNLSGITLDGNGTVFYREGGNGTPRRPRPYIELDTFSNVQMFNFSIQGFEPDWRYSTETEFDSGLRIRSGTGLAVRNVSVSRVGGDGVNILGRVSRPNRNVLVDGVRVDWARRQGMSVRNCDGVTIQNSFITWTGRSGIDIEPYDTTWYADNVTIRRCRLAHINNWIIAGGGAGRHDGHLIEEVDSVGGYGFALIGNYQTSATRVVIRNNRHTWDDPEYRQTRSLNSLRVRASDAVTISGNVMTFRSGGAVEVRAPAGWVTRNTFAGVADGLLLIGGVRGADNIVLNRYGQPAPIVVMNEPTPR
jgi:hypothetical protein